jgi:aryl-alcohol dehydrogenase-like predicted oxidoreductase
MVAAIGCMRLSAAEVDGARAETAIVAALEAGVRTLDTADVYGPDDASLHHNERLIARVLSQWSGADVRVFTKGGLTRPGGRWVPDGRAKHLRAACEASAEALGVSCIERYQLHAVDPKTNLATSARALKRLQRDGLIREVGLCNVTVEQIETVRKVVPVASVQVALSPWDTKAIRSGVVAHCRQHGIELLFHSPLGGWAKHGRVDRDRHVTAAVAGTELTPAQAVLAWLRSLGGIPLPGPTRVETAQACGVARLEPSVRDALDARTPVVHQVRVPMAQRRPEPDAQGEVVLVMGMQGVGKTTRAQTFVEQGYVRLNRDEAGGTLKTLHRTLDALLGEGTRRVVLDNTYPSRAVRNEVVEIAWRHGVPVRAVWFDAPVEDARLGVVQRMLARYERLLEPDEFATLAKTDPGVFGPRVHARYGQSFEPPSADEGLEVEVVPARAVDASGPLWFAIDLKTLLDADPVAVDAAYARGERPLVAIAWQPSDVQLQALDALRDQLDVPLPLYACSHPPGPLVCWCRPPMPGLLLAAAHAHGLSLGAATYIGPDPFGRRFAEACRLAGSHTALP